MQDHKLQRYMKEIKHFQVGDLLTGKVYRTETVGYCVRIDSTYAVDVRNNRNRGSRYHISWIVGGQTTGRKEEYFYPQELASLLNCGLKMQHKRNVNNGKQSEAT